MPTPTIGQTVTFKANAGDQASVTMTGVAVVVVGGYVVVAGAADTTGAAAGRQDPDARSVPVGNILTAT